MKRMTFALFLALPLSFAAGCASTDEAVEEIVICDGCGVEKGTEGCCDAEAPRCDDCGKIKGSPGCCK